MFVGSKQHHDVREDEPREEIKEEHGSTQVAIPIEGAHRPRGEGIHGDEYVNACQRTRKVFLLRNELHHRFVLRIVMFGCQRHASEVQRGCEQDDEGQRFHGDERHITVHRESRCCLNIGKILENITDNKEGHDLELLSDGHAEGFWNRPDQLVHLVGQNDGKRGVQGVQVGVDKAVKFRTVQPGKAVKCASGQVDQEARNCEINGCMSQPFVGPIAEDGLVQPGTFHGKKSRREHK